MDTSTPAGLWMNIDCSEKLPVACIRKANAFVTPTRCLDGPWTEDTIITSPGFPYNASTPCEYFFNVADGKRVEVEIVVLEANSCCDFLVLTDGFLGGHIIANLTGAVTNVTYITSSTNLMRVSWQPNGGVNVMGVAVKSLLGFSYWKFFIPFSDMFHLRYIYAYYILYMKHIRK
ncbi:hypothetical protein PMAYCL1PPCAC_27077 [Pristionchus mayeri]|uniref:CUB domain-containing protein n=1 Tax=Pristionchus mayeri TaxID=1317129 RepID=A0AAN5D6E3_9BILA|nr:hypothetical protein PMAYCL1PPCAC_27077 [Pristionchus mayeri]